MQATDPPIPKCKYSQQQINLPLAASALCCHAKLLYKKGGALYELRL